MTNDERKEKVMRFLDEVISVCRKHGMSISHEDEHGGFVIKRFSESDTEWLQVATISRELLRDDSKQ